MDFSYLSIILHVASMDMTRSCLMIALMPAEPFTSQEREARFGNTSIQSPKSRLRHGARFGAYHAEEQNPRRWLCTSYAVSEELLKHH